MIRIACAQMQIHHTMKENYEKTLLYIKKAMKREHS